MSTLPFLLSVADELDNLNSQSYMDDFGLGFHPHRQYYRTPTIQLSLPASTDWMQQDRQQRFRSHKFYDGTHQNFQSTVEDENPENPDNDDDNDDDHHYHDNYDRDRRRASGNTYEANMEQRYGSEPSTSSAAAAAAAVAAGVTVCAGNQAASNRQKSYASALNSNRNEQTDSSRAATLLNLGSRMTAMRESGGKYHCKDTKDANDAYNDDDDDDNIDNSVRMYNLSKKCCKNYHRHAIETNAKELSGSGCSSVGGGGASGVSSYRLHSKCMEGNNSSSDESLQKVSSSIEFLTCFLLKRSRASSSSSKNASSSGGAGGSGKKS